VRNTVIYDKVTPWIAAGRPLVDNSASATVPVNGPVFTRNNLARPVFVLGQTAGAVPFTSWGGNATVVSNGPEAALTGPDVTQDITLANVSVFPLDNNPTVMLCATALPVGSPVS